MEKIVYSGERLRNMVYFYRPKKNEDLKKRTINFLKHLLYKYIKKTDGDYLLVLERYKFLATAHNQESTRRVGEMIIPPLGRHIWEKTWINEIISVPFEMIRINVPAGYEQCLNVSFGTDWRTPKQLGNYHGKILFDVNQPYTEYLKKK